MPISTQEVDDLRERIAKLFTAEREVNKHDQLVTSLIVRLQNQVDELLDALAPAAPPPGVGGAKCGDH